MKFEGGAVGKLTSLGISFYDEKGYRSLEEIMEDIADIWCDLEIETQLDIVEASLLFKWIY